MALKFAAERLAPHLLAVAAAWASEVSGVVERVSRRTRAECSCTRDGCSRWSSEVARVRRLEAGVSPHWQCSRAQRAHAWVAIAWPPARLLGDVAGALCIASAAHREIRWAAGRHATRQRGKIAWALCAPSREPHTPPVRAFNYR